MRTLLDIYAGVKEMGAGDLDRALSEFGLPRAEVEGVIDETLIVNTPGVDPEEVVVPLTQLRPLLVAVYGEGVMTGIVRERERRG